MDALHETKDLLSKLTRAEKAQVLQWIVRDLGDAFPGVESIPGVSGGEPCIVRTRIPVWVLVQARRLGTSDIIELDSRAAAKDDLSFSRR